MEKKIYELKIDEGLQKIAPPLDENEFSLLRDDIMEHGCLIPIVVWNNTIVDGHNRYAICHELNIPFAVESLEFEDFDEAALWITTHQLGRRNLTKFKRCEMALRCEKKLKEKAEERRRIAIGEYRGKVETPPNSAGSMDTRDVIAKMAGVGHDMVDQVRYILSMADEEMLNGLRTGTISTHKAYKSLKGKSNSKVEKKEEYVDRMRKEPKVTPDATMDCPIELPLRMADDETKPAPIVYLEHPIDVPDMKEDEKPEPIDFRFVREQIQFAVDNMNREVMIGLSRLRDEDKGRVKELIGLLADGTERAKKAIKEAGK